MDFIFKIYADFKFDFDTEIPDFKKSENIPKKAFIFIKSICGSAENAEYSAYNFEED